ncbi:AraC family transcriptional regulator [Actinomadura oligospora]|uniref:AraC family transcriptional regulator n=1 Tax=Actinomadura oligospora TaxID=111804 RepID=UPI0004ACABE8|nr:AraC family transcriptional regulator [Actinomadura oligospora]
MDARRNGGPVTRSELVTGDIDEAHGFLRRNYVGHRPRFSGDRAAFRFRAATAVEGRISLGRITHTLGTRLVTDPRDFLVVVCVLDGAYAVEAGRNEARAVRGGFVALPPGGPAHARWPAAEFGVVGITRPALARAAQEVLGAPVTPVLAGPLSGERVRRWRGAVRFVSHELLDESSGAAGPLLRSEAVRLLTAVYLTTFPVLVGEHSGADGTLPAAVRRARAFVDEHAHRDIGLTDIAEAARTSPRALQDGFRRVLGTTPTAYLREARLDGAHLALRAADPTSGDTVAAIARSWGFAHLGRFAGAYRERFGRTPRETLHE